VCIYSSINVSPNPEPSNCVVTSSVFTIFSIGFHFVPSRVCTVFQARYMQQGSGTRNIHPLWHKWNPLKYRVAAYTAHLLASKNLECHAGLITLGFHVPIVGPYVYMIASMYPRIQKPATVYLYWVPLCAILCMYCVPSKVYTCSREWHKMEPIKVQRKMAPSGFHFSTRCIIQLTWS